MANGKQIKVGDRVVYKRADGSPSCGFSDGLEGTVVFVDGQEAGVTVQFDKKIGGAVSEMRLKPAPDNCRYCRAENLVVLSPAVRRKRRAVEKTDGAVAEHIPAQENEPERIHERHEYRGLPIWLL